MREDQYNQKNEKINKKKQKKKKGESMIMLHVTHQSKNKALEPCNCSNYCLELHSLQVG